MMNPNEDVKSTAGADDFFDDYLKKQFSQSSEYIDNDGFSARVLTQLPQPRKLNKYLEKLILIVPALLIAVLVLSQLPVSDIYWTFYAMVQRISPALWAGIAGVGSIIILAATCWWITHEKS